MPTTRLYQAVLRDPGPTLAKRLRRSVSTWLTGLGFPEIPISPHVESAAEGPGGVPLRASLNARNGCGRFVLEDGSLRTRVTYAQSVEHQTGWVVITVEQYAGEPIEAYAPGFVPGYLATERVTDGGVQVTGAAEEHDEDGVVYLVGELAEHRRRVPIVVVAADSKNGPAARSNAEHLAARVAGVAQVVWLSDLRAQDRFNESVGGDCAVYGGGIRTYLTGLKPGAETYPDRHRVMGGRMLRDDGVRALDRAAGYVIGETAPLKLPDELREAHRLVGRIVQGEERPEALAAAARPRPVRSAHVDQDLYLKMMAMAERRTQVPEPRQADPLPPEPEMPVMRITMPEPPPVPVLPAIDLDELAKSVADRVADRLAGLAETVAGTVVAGVHGELESTLDLISGDPQELSRQMSTMTSHIASLSRALEEAREDRRRAVYRREEAESETERLEDEVERLRAAHVALERDLAEATTRERRLAEQVRQLATEAARSAAPAEVVAEEPFAPRNLVDALHHAAESLEHVRIGDTMHEAGLLDLGHPELCKVWAGKTWDALLALDDYARARSAGEFHGGFRDWCLSASGGRRVISTALLAMKESDSVAGRDKFAQPRTFPVPVEVDPAGRLFMPAHIKLRKTGTPAPRIHFHDDAGGPTGRIWIGYVGDHLPNTRTN
ncbi:hypothetical protein [Actinocorallia longicatena]|uniref:Uncharacterized protein n=1 Tax=Actinocorallia longicatena TaxID=111803 RepID=A0ABP6QBY1_9ACTN